MIKDGTLDKYGKPNEKTPSSWLNEYVDYNPRGIKQEPKEEATDVTSAAIPTQEPQEQRKVAIYDHILSTKFQA